MHPRASFMQLDAEDGRGHSTDPYDPNAPAEDLHDDPKDVEIERNVYGSCAITFDLLADTHEETCTRVQIERIAHCCGMSFLLILSLLLQFAFAIWMVGSISSGDKELAQKLEAGAGAGKYNVFADWRIDEKAGAEYNGVPRLQWANWACIGQDWSWQESKIDDYTKYSASLLGAKGWMMKGWVFGMVAIFLWSANIVSALRGVLSYFMLALPCTKIVRKDQYPKQAVQDELQKLNEHTDRGWWPQVFVKGTVVFIAIARLVAICVLGFNGVKFLAFTDNLKDFILNSVALMFVIDIPDILFKAFASNKEKVSLANIVDGNRIYTDLDACGGWACKECSLIVWTCSGCLSIVIGLIFTSIGCYYLSSFSSNLDTKVYRQLCAATPGDTSKMFESSG